MAEKRPYFEDCDIPDEAAAMYKKESEEVNNRKILVAKKKSPDIAAPSTSVESSQESCLPEEKHPVHKVLDWINTHVFSNPSILDEHLQDFDPFEIGLIFTRLCNSFVTKGNVYYGLRNDGQIFLKRNENCKQIEFIYKSTDSSKEKMWINFGMTRKIKLDLHSSYYVEIMCPANKRKKLPVISLSLWFNTASQATEVFKVLRKHRK